MNEPAKMEIMDEAEGLLTEEEYRFAVDDDQKAEWCMNRIREAIADEKKWIGFYNEQIEKVKKTRESRVTFFEGLLRRYFDRIPHKRTKTQENYPLPSGKLVLKRQDPEFDINEPDFLKWLKETGMTDYIQVEEFSKWGEFKKTLMKTETGKFVTVPADDGTCQVVTNDGTIVPGVKATIRPDVFKVEVKA